MNYEEYLILGRQHYDRGDYEAAITCFKEAIAVSSDAAMAYFYMGSAYHKLGNFDEALNCYHDFAKAEGQEKDSQDEK